MALNRIKKCIDFCQADCRCRAGEETTLQLPQTPAPSPAPLTLDWLNDASPGELIAQLGGLYEHSAWIVERARAQWPWTSLAQYKQALVAVVQGAGRSAQLGLLLAHPELAGKAAIAGTLTADSAQEQATAGLGHCSSDEYATVQRLNAAYRERHGWPFILAVRGPRGTGLDRATIIATLQRRLGGQPEAEFAESLRQVHRIAELRLNDRFGVAPTLGELVWDQAMALARHTDAVGEGGASPALTVTYLTPAHRACAEQLRHWMLESGCDTAHIDAVGNVVGVYAGSDPAAPRLLTGSHYDTVRNGGRHDGRLGILVPLAAVRALHAAGRRPRHGIEIVAYAEEEGQRYKATFLGSSALAGQFDPQWLAQCDAEGTTMREAMQAAGLPATMEAIADCRRDPAAYLGFVEVHIEQGPVLADLGLPLAAVTSINGSVRFLGEITGTACHAGTTPMHQRHDAATAAAELALYIERRAAEAEGLVGTVGMLHVPDGSINVVPGACRFSIDIRSPSDADRDAMEADVREALAAICTRRGVRARLDETMRAAAAPCDAGWRGRWERAIAATGLPVHRMPSGAGHDAMMLHRVMPQAMLFVRGQNDGISHNPLEEITADDAQLAVEAFLALIDTLDHDNEGAG